MLHASSPRRRRAVAWTGLALGFAPVYAGWLWSVEDLDRALAAFALPFDDESSRPR